MRLGKQPLTQYITQENVPVSKEVLIMGNEKYTQKVIDVFQTAQQIAALHYNQEITSVHMLMGLVKEPKGLLDTIF